MAEPGSLNVLYSFPHALGAGRICYTAWQQVNGLAAAGARVQVHAASIRRRVPGSAVVRPTLAVGKWRVPYALVGSRRAFAAHDYLVSRRLESQHGTVDGVDIIHAWPQGCLRTIRVAKALGIPVVLERPNAHTRFAYEVVQKECDRIGVALPRDHEHAHNEDILKVEEAEFDAADELLCPSEFVVKTFKDRGFAAERLARHIYGYDETTYYPASPESARGGGGIRMLFVGVCAVRKGLHFALEAWLRSPACRAGTFTIAGEFLPAYREMLAPLLAHPSVKVLGHSNDIARLMRESDVLVLPSIEEGFGLVCTEAMGSGCVPLVSEACTDLCQHGINSLVHRIGDVDSIRQHITLLHDNPETLQRLRLAGLRLAPQITWNAAGVKLLDVYAGVIERYRERPRQPRGRNPS